MLSPSDLRVNNFYNLGGSLVFQLDLKYFKEFIKDERALENLEGVPLSPEWFSKFKFKKNSIEYYREIEHGGEFYIFSIEHEENGYFYRSSSIVTKLEFVHQLQTLFYSLTKTEIS